MRLLQYFLLLKSLAIFNCEEENHVLVLTKDNFEETIENTENILVEFYAPWCGHCQALEPHFKEAAAQLAKDESNIKLAMVDATKEGELAEKHNVRGYPTLKFFKKGTPMDYGGGRTSEKIIEWLSKKTGPAAKELNTVEDVKEFIKTAPVMIVGFFKEKDSELHKNFLEVAGTNDEFAFGIVYEDSVMSEYVEGKDAIVLFKDFDDGKVMYDGDGSSENIASFIQINCLELVVEFTHETASKIFNQIYKVHLLIFLSKEAGHFEEYVPPLKEVAKEFKGKVVFVSINSDVADNERVMEYFGIKKPPVLRLIHFADDNQGKYKPSFDGMDPDQIRVFINEYFDDKLEPHLLTQDLPEDWDKNPVKVLTGGNFDQVAFDKEKNVLVEFYAPWCGHCKQLAPIYDELGDNYKNSEDVVIAKMDATLNELKHTKIESFPTLKLYKKETNEIVEYNGERTLDGLSKFLETGGDYGKAAADAEVDDVEEEDEDAEAPMKDEL